MGQQDMGRFVVFPLLEAGPRRVAGGNALRANARIPESEVCMEQSLLVGA